MLIFGSAVLRISCVAVAALLLGAGTDQPGDPLPPPPPRLAPPREGALMVDNFKSGNLSQWDPDRPGVWSLKYGLLRAQLPDGRQQRSFIYAGSEQWTDYAVDLDVCGMRGVDKGVALRVVGRQGIGVDLRGPGYQDVVMYRREWPMGKARVVNGNGVWHHLRVEARANRYRVWVNGDLTLDKVDPRNVCPGGRIALPAYTGGQGECTVYYDNVVVSAIEQTAGASRR
jgi:hypothetical protein